MAQDKSMPHAPAFSPSPAQPSQRQSSPFSPSHSKLPSSPLQSLAASRTKSSHVSPTNLQQSSSQPSAPLNDEKNLIAKFMEDDAVDPGNVYSDNPHTTSQCIGQYKSSQAHLSGDSDQYEDKDEEAPPPAKRRRSGQDGGLPRRPRREADMRRLSFPLPPDFVLGDANGGADQSLRITEGLGGILAEDVEIMRLRGV